MDWMNGLVVTAALRGLTVAASAYLSSRGIATGEEVQTVVGALGTLAGIGLMMFKRTTSQMVKDTQNLPQVTQVITKR